MTEGREKLIGEVTESLRKIQEFNPSSIARVEELGKDLNFQDGVETAGHIVDLFRQIPLEFLHELPSPKLELLKLKANTLDKLFHDILQFNSIQPRPKDSRDSLLGQLDSAYNDVFDEIGGIIAYMRWKSADFGRMKQETQTALRSIKEQSASIAEELQQLKLEAEEALRAIRQVSEEQGVSQQAIYFKEEAEKHTEEAGKWLKRTSWLTAILGVYAAATLFIHKIPWLAPSNSFEAIQLVAGKVLVFATISYFLVLSARNFMAHRHNAVVNKHRQNSLATYRALVEAAGDQANRDIVLAKAADSIFTAQPTGFAKSAREEGKTMSMFNVNPSLLRTPGGME